MGSSKSWFFGFKVLPCQKLKIFKFLQNGYFWCLRVTLGAKIVFNTKKWVYMSFWWKMWKSRFWPILKAQTHGNCWLKMLKNIDFRTFFNVFSKNPYIPISRSIKTISSTKTSKNASLVVKRSKWNFMNLCYFPYKSHIREVNNSNFLKMTTL